MLSGVPPSPAWLTAILWESHRHFEKCKEGRSIKCKWEVSGRVAVALWSTGCPCAPHPHLSRLPQLPSCPLPGLYKPLTCVTVLLGKPGAAGSPPLVSGVPFIHEQVSKDGSEPRVLMEETCGTARWGRGAPMPQASGEAGFALCTQAEGSTQSPRPLHKQIPVRMVCSPPTNCGPDK